MAINANEQVAPVNDVTGTTTFDEDAPGGKLLIRSGLELLSLGPQMSDQNSIKDFLLKPLLLYTFDWTTASGANTLLYNTSPGAQLLANQIWLRKLQGYNLIRGTAVLRVEINAQPFQQGRLIICAIPNGRDRLIYSKDSPMRLSNLCNVTQLPNIELDCRDTVAELEIPYVSPTTYFDLTTEKYDWAEFYIRVLSTMYSGLGTPFVSCSVFMYFKDIELAAPTFEAHSLSMGGAPKSPDYTTRIKRGNARLSSKLGSEEPNRVLSTSFDAISKASSVLTVIPGLSAICAGISGVASSASKLLYAFGYSKPLNAPIPTIVIPSSTRNMFHSNPCDNSQPLAVNANAKLEPVMGFAGSEVDEMSYNYLKVIPAFSRNLFWNAAQVTDDLVVRIPIAISNLQDSFVRNTVTWSATPPYLFLASKHQYWRGSIKVILKFVKTDFHSGRLLVTYTPDSTSTGPTNFESAYSLRQVLDIREKSEFEFELPYLPNYSYSTFTDVVGTFQIKVLNPLVTNDSVNPNIEILMFTAGGADFEVAVPFENHLGRVFVAESGDMSHNAMTIGDPINSVKQILTRTEKLVVVTSGSLNTTIIYNPFVLMYPSVDSLGVAAFKDTSVYKPYKADFMSGYSYARGGYRIVVTYRNTVPNTIPSAWYEPATTGQLFVSGSGPVLSARTTVQALAEDYIPMINWSRDSGCVDVKVPGTARTPQRIIGCKTEFDGTPFDNSEIFAPPYQMRFTTQDGLVSEGCSDDYMLGYFLGFLPQYISP